jgi:hypothetical protein
VEDLSITEGIPGSLVAYRDIKYGYGGGRALPMTAARLRVGDKEYTQSILPGDKGIVFTIDMEIGETELQTYFHDETHMEIGAYYVYVQHADFSSS